MKVKINYLLVFFLFALLSFTSCQDEAVEVENPNEQETIVPNSNLANLMRFTTANFGAADDILDGSSCFSVELPVTIVVSDITIVIETEADLEQLEDLFNDLNDDEDFLDFVFPITIIFSDYTELIIENEDQLESFINECEEEDVIECVDFVYPISFSVFNSEFSLIDTVTIADDEALYEFLENLEDDENAIIVSLNYPVTLEYADGETVEVNSNEELVEAIEAAEENCDDDEEDDCDEEEIALNLVECPWEVFLYTNDDLENLDGPYIFNFNEDGSLVIDGITDEPHNTNWELTETDNGLELNIQSFYYYEQEFGTWLVVECDDDELKFEHLTVDGTGLFFDQDCEDDLDCSITDISDILQECPWDFTDGTDAYNNYQMMFNDNGELLIPEGVATSAIGGNWDLSISNDGLPEIVISNLTAFQDDLEGSWIIIECDEDGELTIVRGNTIIELEQDCEGDLGCSVAQINANIVECAWQLQTNLIDTLVVVYVYFTPNGQVLLSNNNGTETQVGTWEMVTIASDIFIEFTFQSGFEILNGQWQIVECEEGELYLVSGNNYISLDQNCDIDNDQELFNCFDDFEIVECNQPNNVPVYNLNAGSIGLVDCTQNFIASFHTTEADAVNDVNPIENTEAYGTLVAQVYLRIETDSGNFEIFTIYLNTEDCNYFECFIDAEITACSENNDDIATFDLTEVNQECGPDIAIYGIYYFESLNDAQNNVNPISNPQAYTNTANPITVYGAVLNVSSNVVEHIFTITLNVENCNLFECFQSFDAVIEICDNGTDGPNIFNLTIAFANCTPSADIVTYHETQVDAETGANVIANPAEYNTADVSSTIYTRVEVDNEFEVFPIQLIVADCNETCSEEDVDSFLTECIWSAVSYNGSDNLMEYNFDFESNSQIVVIYTDEITIDASWSTAESSDGVIIEFSNVAGPNIQAITGEWLVVECEENRLELHRENDILVLERNCD
ncbi:hypothetical protein [Winogradskyella sp.]|uniref:hypothetical protein n=1 Tax=Winogradskyella sp. TaxID=1883156 RepID=UPI0025F88735|nr:hypothetical protein [Winogradskyella sp.]